MAIGLPTLPITLHSSHVEKGSFSAVSGKDYVIPTAVDVATHMAWADAGAADRVHTLGYAEPFDGGAATYVKVTAAVAHDLCLKVTDGSGHYRWFEIVPDEDGFVNARAAGVKADGATCDAAALNKLGDIDFKHNIRLPEGEIYIATSDVKIDGNQKRIVGAGKLKTKIKVAATFLKPTYQALFRLRGAEQEITDMTFVYDQSGVTGRTGANPVKDYPPAIVFEADRLRVRRIQIREAKYGIWASGAGGQSELEDVQVGAFEKCFFFDGLKGYLRLKGCSTWPHEFNTDPTLFAIYTDGQTVGFEFGEVDDLQMSDCIPWRAQVIFRTSSVTAGKAPFGTVTGLALDGNASRVDFRAGEVAFSSVYCTIGTDITNDYAFKVSGGQISLSDFDIDIANNSTTPAIEVTGGVAVVGRGIVTLGNGSGGNVRAVKVSGGRLNLSNVEFVQPAGKTRTVPVVEQAGTGELLMTGCGINSFVAGSTGPFVYLAGDGGHVVSGNAFNGWGFSHPDQPIVAVLGPNAEAGAYHMDGGFRMERAYTSLVDVPVGTRYAIEPAANFGILFFIAAGNKSGMFAFQLVPGNLKMEIVAQAGSSIEVTTATGAPAITSCTSGKITLVASDDGHVYIVNRLSNYTCRWLTLC